MPRTVWPCATRRSSATAGRAALARPWRPAGGREAGRRPPRCSRAGNDDEAIPALCSTRIVAREFEHGSAEAYPDERSDWRRPRLKQLSIIPWPYRGADRGGRPGPNETPAAQGTGNRLVGERDIDRLVRIVAAACAARRRGANLRQWMSAFHVPVSGSAGIAALIWSNSTIMCARRGETLRVSAPPSVCHSTRSRGSPRDAG